jgi:hypothetical protein
MKFKKFLAAKQSPAWILGSFVARLSGEYSLSRSSIAIMVKFGVQLMENRAGDYPPGELSVASCLFFGGRVEVRSIDIPSAADGMHTGWQQRMAAERV